jgi:predicted kinase
MIGLPASGKSTVAKQERRLKPNTVIVSRDDIREAYFGENTNYSTPQEQMVTRVEETMVESAVEQGKNVIIDAMHIRRKYRQKWAKVAVRLGVPLRYIDLTHVPLEHCVQRDDIRRQDGERSVGIEFIRYYHRTFFHGNVPVETPESLTEALKEVPEGHDPYRWGPGLPEAIIVDIDGTVASHEGIRDPYDTSRYHLDQPRWDVIKVVQDYAYRTIPKKVIFVSGRDAAFRGVTEQWLYEHVKVPIEGLFMRPEGDTRRDDIVKLELFDQNIRGKYNIFGVYDDRDRVVKAWRSISLPVFQVNEGNF